MEALYPGARDCLHPCGMARPKRNPVITSSPARARDAVLGSRPRPAYAPPPVGASRNEIIHAKTQLIQHQKAIADIKTHIANIEVMLSRLDPQYVVACVVPGYTDPPERVAAAERDKAAGNVTDGAFAHRIYGMKQRIVHYRNIVEHTEAHNDYIVDDLCHLDPQSVVAVKIAGYEDPHETVTRAAAAKAADEVPTPQRA